jgi:hypothetical protein
MIIRNSKYTTVLLIFLFALAQLFAQERETIVILDNSFAPPPEIEEQKEKEHQDSIDVVTFWNSYFSKTNEELTKIYRFLCNIDSTKLSKSEIEKQVEECENNLENENNFKTLRETNSLWKKNNDLDLQRGEYDKRVRDIENKIKEWKKFIVSPPPPPDDIPWLTIIIAVGVLAMSGLPVIMQILAKRSAKKQQKETEWQTMNVQCQQIPQVLDKAYIPLIQNLILQYENFIEKKPKKMYKDAALAKIKELKVRQLKINKKINIQ